MDMTPNEFKCSTSTCWDKEYQTLTDYITTNKSSGRNQLG